MQRTIRLPALAVSLVCLTLAVQGCEKVDPTSSQYWIGQLSTEQRRDAIRKLGDMKAADAVKPLMEAYKDDRHRQEIIAALAQIGDKAAAPTLIEALKDKDEEKAGELAAKTLLEWKVPEAADTAVAVIGDPGTPKEIKYGALLILAEWPKPEAIPTLLQVLTADPDIQPIVLAGLAAEALGKLKADKAVPGLVRCLWLDDNLRRNVVPQCRLAINRIGAPAIPELIKTLERKNREVEDRARKLKYDKGGLIEAKAAELLGDLGAKDAVEPLIAALKNFEAMPPSVQQNPDKAKAFVMAGVQKVISIANALAGIGDDRAVDPLLMIAADKELALEHKLSAVQQLGFLGSTKAIPGLMKQLERDPHPRDPVSNGFRVQIALNIANLLDGVDTKAVEALEKQVAAIRATLEKWKADTLAEQEKAPADEKRAYDGLLKGYAEWGANYDEVDAKIAAVKECTDDPVCWGKKLDDPKIAVQLLAGYRLSQMADKADTAKLQLVKKIGTEDLTLRNVILFGLDRLGDASLLPQLQEAHAADEARAAKDKSFRGAVYTLDLMIARLGNKTAG